MSILGTTMAMENWDSIRNFNIYIIKSLKINSMYEKLWLNVIIGYLYRIVPIFLQSNKMLSYPIPSEETNAII